LHADPLQQESRRPETHGNHNADIVHVSSRIPTGARRRLSCDVIVAYRNGIEWLKQSIDSLLWQRSVSLTIHLINDDSTESDGLVKTAFAGYENIRWYHNDECIGPFRSANRIIPHLETEFVAIQDADDIALPNRLWRGIDSLQRYEADVYGAGMEQFVDPADCSEKNHASEEAERIPFIRSGRWCLNGVAPTIVNGAAIMRRSVFEELNGFSGNYMCGDDTEFYLRCFLAGCKMLIDSQVAGLRRCHMGSLSRSKTVGVRTKSFHHRRQELFKIMDSFNSGTPLRSLRSFGELAHGVTPANRICFPTTRCFVVTSSGRDGSNMLCDMLNRHSQVHCEKEVIGNEEFRKRNVIRIGSTAQQILKRFVYRGQNRAEGFKLMDHQGHSGTEDDCRRYLKALHCWVIHLRRRNLLRKFLSHKIATDTNVWTTVTEYPTALTVTVNLEEAVAYFDRTLRSYSAHEKEFSGQPSLTVYFEELVECPQSEVDRCFEFLGVFAEPVETIFQRQEHRSIPEIVENYAELEYALRGTEWYAFLQE